MTLENDKENSVKGEYARLEKSGISKDGIEKIKQFVSDLKVGKDIGRYREYYYLTRLRKIGEFMGDKFLNPTEQDLKALIAELPLMDVHINGRNTHRKYSVRTIQDYKHGMKMFYKWLGKPGIVEWIRLSNGKTKKRPEDIITPEDMKRLIRGTNRIYGTRDQALLYTLYDSGCRIGELLGLRNKDIKFDDYGAVLSVFGKTGYRNVRVVGNSVSYLRKWQNTHPFPDDADAWFFCKMADSVRGEQFTHHDVYKMLRQAVMRAGIKKRIHPHLFRHTRATLLASKVMEAPLELQMGWVHGSRMTQTYVHLSGRDQDNAILKAYGIKVPEEGAIETERPAKCPRCAEPNNDTARFCWKCGMILDRELTENKLQDEAREIEKSLMKSSVIDNSTKELIRNFPEEFKDAILETVIRQVLNSPDLSRKFREELAIKK